MFADDTIRGFELAGLVAVGSVRQAGRVSVDEKTWCIVLIKTLPGTLSAFLKRAD